MERLIAILAVFVALIGCSGPALPGSALEPQADASDPAATPAGPLAYVVTGGFTGEFGVSVISTTTNEIVDTIDTGQFLGQDVVVTPDGRSVYVVGVAPRGGGQALAIATATNEIVATIDMGPAGTSAQFAVVSPDGAFVYAVHGGTTGAIYVISTATNTVVDTVQIGAAAGQPAKVEITPDGRLLYLMDKNLGLGTVTVISTAGNEVLTTIDTGAHPDPTLAVAPNGATIYVPGGFPDVLSVISTATHTVDARIELPPFFSVRSVVVAPDSSTVYILGSEGSPGPAAVTVVSAATNQELSSSNVEARFEDLWDVLISPDGEFIYAADPGQGVVYVISTATSSLEATLRVGSFPQYMALTPDNAFLYVTNTFSDSVSVISTATNTVVETIRELGDQPKQLAITP